MQTEMLVAVIGSVSGVLGAVAGGGIGLLGAASDRKSRERTEDRARDDSASALRRQTYAGFLAKIDLFCDAARAVTAAVDAGAGPEECGMAQRRHEEAWAAMVESMGAVQMIAPFEVGEAAADVWAAGAEYSNAVDDRFAGKRWSKAFNVKAEGVVEARRAFAKLALQSLGVAIPPEKAEVAAVSAD